MRLPRTVRGSARAARVPAALIHNTFPIDILQRNAAPNVAEMMMIAEPPGREREAYRPGRTDERRPGRTASLCQDRIQTRAHPWTQQNRGTGISSRGD